MTSKKTPAKGPGDQSKADRYDPTTVAFAIPDDVLKAEAGKFSMEEFERRYADRESDLSRRLNARSRSALYRRSEAQASVLQSKFGETCTPGMDINWLRTELESSNARLAKGDMSEVEGMLSSQAHALSSIFTTMALKAQANMGTHLGAMETYLRLALKAQSQCRTTLETLAEIKNPKAVAFVKQANIANGPQQVNNSGMVARESAPIPQSEVLEHVDGERLDFGAPGAAGRADQELEAVGAVHGAEVGRREGTRRPELVPRRLAS